MVLILVYSMQVQIFVKNTEILGFRKASYWNTFVWLRWFCQTLRPLTDVKKEARWDLMCDPNGVLSATSHMHGMKHNNGIGHQILSCHTAAAVGGSPGT